MITHLFCNAPFCSIYQAWILFKKRNALYENGVQSAFYEVLTLLEPLNILIFFSLRIKKDDGNGESGQF